MQFTTSDERISTLLKRVQETTDLLKLEALASWDQHTQMPERAGEARMHQVATLDGIIHERQSDPALGKLLQELEGVVSQSRFTDADRSLVRHARRSYDQATKLPPELVEERAKVAVASLESWVKARQNNDFASFAPWLQRTVHLQREIADRLGYTETRFDALIDLHDPGLTASEVEALFVPIRDVSTRLLKRIQASGKTIDTACLFGNFPISQQEALCKKMAASVGYDFTRGMIASSAHPFMIDFGTPLDVRFTVRYSEQFLPMALMAALHEGGHALYEQGSAPSLLRTPLAGGASSGIHESQSRLWENVIGRSEPFWQKKFALVQEAFPQHFAEVPLPTFVQALNKVEPSLIRVEADEVTYNLHIMVRFELEKVLVNGEISVESLPRLWNEKYREYLGIEPENDTVGVLQDMHWSDGFGGFQGYTIGNICAAQIFKKLQSEFPDLKERLAGGDTSFILQWLSEHMYSIGATYLPQDLMVRLTGESMNPNYLLSYLTGKFEKIYDLSPES
ncbi:carboxypeptidase M32 [Ktedonosporobacter rubrisoli]|nr:carboxypeptidase M32 [Ktedonosporobacter rubrisoli]